MTTLPFREFYETQGSYVDTVFWVESDLNWSLSKGQSNPNLLVLGVECNLKNTGLKYETIGFVTGVDTTEVHKGYVCFQVRDPIELSPSDHTVGLPVASLIQEKLNVPVALKRKLKDTILHESFQRSKKAVQLKLKELHECLAISSDSATPNTANSSAAAPVRDLTGGRNLAEIAEAEALAPMTQQQGITPGEETAAPVAITATVRRTTPQAATAATAAPAAAAASGPMPVNPAAPLAQVPLSEYALRRQDIERRCRIQQGQTLLWRTDSLIRPPAETVNGVEVRDWEVRDIHTGFKDALKTRIIHNPLSNTKPSFVMLDPAQCATPEDFSMEKFSKNEYKGWVGGGSHKNLAKNEILADQRYTAFKPFVANEAGYTYAGLTKDEFHLLANEDNADQQFAREFSNVDKINAFHREFVKAGGSAFWATATDDDKWLVKDQALQSIGRYDVDKQSKEWKSVSWLWFLASHDGETWESLHTFLTNYELGKTKDQKQSVKKRIAKLSEGVKKSLSAKGPSPQKTSSKKQLPKRQKRIAISTGENSVSVQTSTVEYVKIPVHQWLSFMGMSELVDGNEYKAKLFKRMAAGSLSLDEASMQAKKFKALRAAMLDFCEQVGCATWAEAKEKFPRFTTDERMEAITAEYMNPKSKNITTESGTKISPSLNLLVQNALQFLSSETDAPLHDEFQFETLTRLSQLSEEQINADLAMEMKYSFISGDVTKLVEDKLIPKLPFRLAFMDPPYTLNGEGGFTDDDLEKVIIGVLSRTSAPIFTLIVFCGHEQSSAFFQKLKAHFTTVEKIYWVKPNHWISGFNRHSNQVEEAFVAVKSETPLNAATYHSVFNWGPAEDEPGLVNGSSVTRNFYYYNKVTKPFKYSSTVENQVLNTSQKPLALMEDIISTYGVSASWAIDLCAGSGSFSMAALRLGLNVIAVDSSEQMIRGMSQRVAQCLTENVDTECGYSENENTPLINDDEMEDAA